MKKTLIILLCIICIISAYSLISIELEQRELIKESFATISNDSIEKCVFVSTVKVHKSRYSLYNINNELYVMTFDGKIQHINCIK